MAVPRERDERPVRTFQTFSGDLDQLADWLHAVGITTVAMESTGVYWIPVFEILAARLVDTLSAGSEWIYEAKFDGYRALALKDGEKVRILSRKGNDLTADLFRSKWQRLRRCLPSKR